MTRTILFRLAVVVCFLKITTLPAQKSLAELRLPPCSDPLLKAVLPPPAKLTCLQNQISLEAKIEGRSGVFQFFWTQPDGFQVASKIILADEPGIYTFIIVDENWGCTVSASTLVSDARIFPKLAALGGTLTCRNPQTTLHLAALPSSLCFEWSGPKNFAENIASPTVSEPGIYSLLATEPQSGCSATASVEVFENKNLPDVKIAAPQILTCNHREIWLDGAGSSAGSEFVNLWWSANGFSTSPEDSLATRANVPDIYTLLITNSLNGCSASKNIELAGADDFPKPDLTQSWGSIFEPNFENTNSFFAAAPLHFSDFSNAENTTVNRSEIKFIQKLKVFDPRGLPIFSAAECPPNLSAASWNVFFKKNKLLAGTYFWKGQVVLADGRTVVLDGKVVMK